MVLGNFWLLSLFKAIRIEYPPYALLVLSWELRLSEIFFCYRICNYWFSVYYGVLPESPNYIREPRLSVKWAFELPVIAVLSLC